MAALTGTVVALAALAWAVPGARAQGWGWGNSNGSNWNQGRDNWNQGRDGGWDQQRRGGWGGQSYRREYAAPYADERYGGAEFTHRPQRGPAAPEYAPRERGPSYAGGSSGGALCVRLCDGRYFPIPRLAQGTALNTAKVCGALCPAAKTQVFNGSNPESAVASDGTRYASLAHAFAFRDKIVPNCSCTGHGPGGLAQIDIETDPTLRAGDIVAARGGLTVFKGSGSFPYKVADFTPLQSYAKANDEIRRKLSNVRVDATARAIAPVKELAATPEEKPAGKSRSRRHRAAANANRRDARASFDGWFR